MFAALKAEKYLLISSEHLIGWPIERVTSRDTSDMSVDFITDEIIYTFGSLQAIISNNAKCFTACTVQKLMEKYRIKWKIVMEYASISNGLAKRIVGTITRSITDTVLNERKP